MHHARITRGCLLALSLHGILFQSALNAPAAAGDHLLTAYDIPLTSTATPPQQSGPAAANTQTGARPQVGRRFRAPAVPRISGVAAGSNSAITAPPLEGPGSASVPPSAEIPNAALPALEPPSHAGETPVGSSPPTPPDGLQTPANTDPFGDVRRPTIPLEVAPDEEPAESGRESNLPAPLQVGRPRTEPIDEDQTEQDDEAEKPRRRRRGLLGRVRGRDESIPPAPRARRPIDDTQDSDSDLQQRLEREITKVAGRHLKGLDVVVKGSKIRIRADVDRFWNRRVVKRTIADLPLLAGYDAVVVVD
jgi:hypothetical protein